MGKLLLLKTLQVCLSKFKGGKIYEEDSPWRFSCGYPKTQSFSLERNGECTSEEQVYQSFNSLYIVSDLKSVGVSQSLFPLPEEKEEEEGGGGAAAGLGSCESKRFVICYDENNCSSKSWFYEEDLTSKSSTYSSDFSSDSSRSSGLPVGLVNGLSSERFFFPPAGRSNSILEEAKSFHSSVDGSQNSPGVQREKIDLSFCMEEFSETDDPGTSSRVLSCSVADPSCLGDEWALRKSLSFTEADLYDIFLSDSVAVQMHSPNPYLDFRISMQEMVEAHNLTDWSFLQEMLFCYLRLNKKKTHKFIVGAFADLLVNIVATTSPLLEYTACKDTR